MHQNNSFIVSAKTENSRIVFYVSVDTEIKQKLKFSEIRQK